MTLSHHSHFFTIHTHIQFKKNKQKNIYSRNTQKLHSQYLSVLGAEKKVRR